MATKTTISINDEYCLTEYRETDVRQLVDLLDTPELYKTTFSIPSPYKESDAKYWIQFATRQHPHFKTLTNWAIRDKNGKLLGGIGFILTEGVTHRGEVGYWLGTPFWGRGIATQVVAKVCEIGFEQFDFDKITAHVFSFNPASCRVLEKNGFENEGFVKKHFCKNGQLIDAYIFGRLRVETTS